MLNFNMNDLLDVWFTKEQLKSINSALTVFSWDCSQDQKEELKPIIEHIKNLLEHYDSRT